VTPEESLLTAVLETTVSDACGKSTDRPRGVREKLRRDAVQWIEGPEFEVVCVQLDLEPERKISR
jgi:hypothetical protein